MSWNETLFAYAVCMKYTDLLLYLQLDAVYLPFNPAESSDRDNGR